MKRTIIIIAFFLITLIPIKMSAVEIRLLGRAGAVYDLGNGKIKVCPGFNFKTCATVTIRWNDIKAIFSNNNNNSRIMLQSETLAGITVLDESGNIVSKIVCTVDWVRQERITQDPPSTLNGDDIIFKIVND